MKSPSKPSRLRTLLRAATCMALSIPLFVSCAKESDSAKDKSADSKEKSANTDTVKTDTKVATNTETATNADTKEVILNVFGMT